MKKTYKVYVNKSIVKDNYIEGEVGNHTHFGENYIASGEHVFEALKNASEELFGKCIDFSECSNIYSTSILCWSRIENDEGIPPSTKELEDWKADERNLYSAMYEFRIVIEQEISKEELMDELEIELD